MERVGRIAIGIAAFLAGWAPFSTFGAPVAISHIAILMALVIAVVMMVLRQRLKILTVDVLLYMYVLVLGLEAWLLGGAVAISYWAMWFVLIASYFSTRILVRTEQALRVLLWFCLSGLLVSVVLLKPTVDEWGNVGRIAIDGVNGNFTAYVVASTLFLQTIYISLRPRSFWQRNRDNILSACLIGIIIYLETRGAILSSVAVLLCRVYGTGSKTRITVAIGVACVVVSFILSFGILDALLPVLDMASNRGTGDLSGRLIIWDQARSLFFENWLFGVGPGAFLRLSERSVGAHNFFLVVALDSGLVGLFLILAGLVAFARKIAFVCIGAGRINMLALFVVYWVPIATSGHWELAVTSWIVVAVAIQTEYFEGAIRKNIKKPKGIMSSRGVVQMKIGLNKARFQ